jgi:hypothetical protein
MRRPRHFNTISPQGPGFDPNPAGLGKKAAAFLQKSGTKKLL